jgi:hypothetical protein
MRYEQKSFAFNCWDLRVLCVRDEKNVNNFLPCGSRFVVLKGQTKPITMKDKFINWFQDVTVWLAWYLIVSTALMAICLVPSFIVDVLCK